MEKVIKSNTITKQVGKAKTRRHYNSDYFCTISWRQKPVSNEWLEEYAKRYVLWVDNVNNKDANGDEPLRIAQFLSKEGISSNDHQRWVVSNDNVSRAHSYVKQQLATRRELGALKFKYNPVITLKHQWKYDEDDYKEVLRQEAREEALMRLRIQLQNSPDGAGTVAINLIDHMLKAVTDAKQKKLESK